MISCIAYGQLSATATEHAAAVISGLAPLAENAMAIKLADGVDPIVQLLSMGTADAKTRVQHNRYLSLTCGRHGRKRT